MLLAMRRSEQTLEGRRENLSQANKLSRTYTLLLEAIVGHVEQGGKTK